MASPHHDEEDGFSLVRAERVLALPLTRCWQELRDLGIAHRYVPGIVRTEITTDQKQGVGASRKVYDAKGKALDETVIEWNEGTGFRLRLHRGEAGPPPPFARAWFRYRLEHAGQEATRVVLCLGYQPRWGLAGRMLDGLLLRRLIRGRIDAVARRLKLDWEKRLGES